MGFPRQGYWSGLPLPSPGDLPNPGIKPRSPVLQVALYSWASWEVLSLGLLKGKGMGNRFQAVPWKLPTLLPLRETWMQGSGWEERGFRFEFSWSCFPGKESICNAGDTNLIRRSGRSPGEGNGNPLQYSCLGKSHGQRSLVGCSPWGSQRVDHNLVTKQQQQTTQ